MVIDKSTRSNRVNFMKNLYSIRILFTSILCLMSVIGICTDSLGQQKKYEPTWTSLEKHEIPDWFIDGKFGIYTHWGVYSVPATGPNGTWYSHFTYMDENSPQRKHHEKTYGPLEEFGYKDFIPMFTAENFDADEWAELFEKSGARWAGPVAEHHDGFAMWNTKFNKYNAARMGPKRDIVGELEKAIKKRGMKFVTSFHHDTNWWFFPTWDKRYDCSNPLYSDLYGPIHEKGEQPTKEYLDEWIGKINEVVDNYSPDLIWFDTGLGAIKESYRKEMLAYYFNSAAAKGKEVVVTYKDNDIPPGIGVTDLEVAQMRTKTDFLWLTDTSIDDNEAWSYVNDISYKSLNRLIDNLVDRVSKNGCLLLNVGPRADGSIPEEAKELLLGIGDWLKINGEAIYGTRPWTIAAEGPTSLGFDAAYGNEADLEYTSEDIRFTVKDNNLYAITLDWPGDELTIRSVTTNHFPNEDFVGIYPSEIKSIGMLGGEKELKWKITGQGLEIEMPKSKPCDYAYALKIELKN